MAKAKKSKAKKSKAKPKKKVKKAARAVASKAKSKKAKKSKKPARKAAAKKPAKKVAKKVAAKKAPKKQIVGEGDYAASRSFLKDQSSFVKRNQAKIPAMGKAAEQALEGPEGASLLAAEAEAKGHSKGEVE